MNPALTLFCDNPEEHGCGRAQAPAPPVTPDLAPGYRYDQVAVNEAAEVIVRGAGPDYWYSDDPRSIVQDVLDIFIDHGGLVATDFGARVDALLREAGIEYPLRIGGLHDLVDQRDGQIDRAEEAEATIIDLRTEVAQLKAKVDRFVALSRQDLAYATKAVAERDKALRGSYRINVGIEP